MMGDRHEALFLRKINHANPGLITPPGGERDNYAEFENALFLVLPTIKMTRRQGFINRGKQGSMNGTTHPERYPLRPSQTSVLIRK